MRNDIRGLVTSSLLIALAFWLISAASPETQGQYYPPAGQWTHKAPADVGMDASKLRDAIEFMKAHETRRPTREFSAQEDIFGKLLASMPTRRGATNGLVMRHGYIVAEFGETMRPDPVYSVAKSMLSTVAGIAFDRGLISDLDEPVGRLVKDGGYDSAQNRLVTWRNHLQQESEWEGEVWGKKSDFVGAEAFGAAEKKPRAIRAPGAVYEYNDVRINRFALSLLRLFRKPLPDVFSDEVMSRIGASTTWKWVPYVNSYVDVDGMRMASVSGGTRWGGGIWMSSHDMARFGLLWLRGGKWGDRQILSPAYVKMAVTASAHGQDYGFLWWLNTRQGLWPGSSAAAFSARGNGGNIIFVDPSHDVVVVMRWSTQSSESLRRIVDAITS